MSQRNDQICTFCGTTRTLGENWFTSISTAGRFEQGHPDCFASNKLADAAQLPKSYTLPEIIRGLREPESLPSIEEMSMAADGFRGDKTALSELSTCPECSADPCYCHQTASVIKLGELTPIE